MTVWPNKRGYSRQKGAGGICPTPAPTPTSQVQSFFELVGPNQRCLEYRPVSSFSTRRQLEAGAGDGGSALVDCARQCYDKGLPVPFFFAINDGACYCCEIWCACVSCVLCV